MDGGIDAAINQRLLDFFRKNALTAEGGQRIEPPVAAGCDEHQFDFNSARTELFRHPIGLPSG
jgi:hypothetical protein